MANTLTELDLSGNKVLTVLPLLGLFTVFSSSDIWHGVRIQSPPITGDP